MKVLVNGAAGFIGFHVSKRLLERGDRVVGIDSINSYYDPKLKYARLAELGIGPEAEEWKKPIRSSKYDNFAFIRMLCEDRQAIEALFAEQKFDMVIHLAAQAGVRYSIDHPYEYIDANICGFITILEGCRRNGVRHLVYASSSSVYGNSPNYPFKETDRVDNPISLYAATKKANELIAYTYSHLYKLSTTGLRFFTVYGPWGRPDMAYFKFTKAIIEEKPISFYNNGDLYRDFTYIDDIVEGVIRVADAFYEPAGGEAAKKSETPYRLFNIGNNKPVRLDYFIKTIEEIIGKKAIIKYEPMQPGDVYRTEADVQQLEDQTGWKPTTAIEIGLRQFANWFISKYRL
jgi:UDP-glucuronate 4-epimerase